MEKRIRRWNWNFPILWFGQFVSDFGNAAFAVAIGFWVLDRTDNNLALMGLVEALFALPVVLLGPFSGAVADRLSRKWIIVSADFMRGVLYSAMGAALIFGAFPFWAIYPTAILAGICSSFFSPAISSSIPDIVERKNLSRANSARSFSAALTQLLGSGLGGVLYAAIRAPLLVFFNGLTFLFASALQLFMKIPRVRSAPQRRHILHDMWEGARYTFGMRGVRTLLITSMIINFFAVTGSTLLTPLFKSTPGFGVERYGYTMAFLMAGMVAGMLVLSVVRVRPARRSGLFGVSILVMALAFVPFGILARAEWLYPLAFVGGVTNSIVNMLVQTIMQSTVPAENRGKVFGILGTVSGSLQPLAMALSGLIAGVAGLRPTIAGAFSVLVFAVLPLLFDRPFKDFINTDIAAQEPDGPAQEGTETAAETAASGEA